MSTQTPLAELASKARALLEEIRPPNGPVLVAAPTAAALQEALDRLAPLPSPAEPYRLEERDEGSASLVRHGTQAAIVRLAIGDEAVRELAQAPAMRAALTGLAKPLHGAVRELESRAPEKGRWLDEAYAKAEKILDIIRTGSE